MTAKLPLTLCLILVSAIVNPIEAAPHDLKATPVTNKLGLQLNQFTFSWNAIDQAAYRVLVASDLPKLNAGVGNLWDSGRRLTPEHTNILYAGKAFPDSGKVWWKVQTWNKDKEAGQFSEPSIIEIAKQQHTAKPQPRPTHKSGEGTLQFIKGRHGKALKFGQGKPEVQAADYRELRSRNGTTLSAWVLPDRTPNGWRCIYRKEDDENRRLLALGQEGPFWGLWFGINITGYKEFGGRIDPKKIMDGQWHHVAATYDGNAVRLFLDGNLLTEKKITGTLGASGSNPAYIGSYIGTKEIFEGGIDDVRVYDHGLSKDDIAKLASGETEVKNNNLAGHWKLDDNIQNEKQYQPTASLKNRVVFVGDTLISRMEKFGYLETALTAQWPNHDITFRNLGWPGDDVFGTARAEFKDGRNTRGWESGPDNGVGYLALLKHVADAEPSAIIIGYGSGVAFAKTGLSLDQFKDGYTRLLEAFEANGAKLILLTPPRQEATGSSLPDLAKRNLRLGQAAHFISELGHKNGHVVVDLFSHLYEPKGQPLTENGVHLNGLGYQRLAKLTMRELGLLGASNFYLTLTPERVESTYGSLTTAPQQIARIRARFPGVVSQVKVNLGDRVERGNVLAQVESNESLQTYALRAPIDGIVIERRISNGEMAGEQPLFAIADLTTLWAEFKVFPGQRAEVAIGQKVRLKADGIEREGTIRHLLPAPGNAPYTLARVEVDNAEGLLTPGLLVAGDIVVETVEAPLVVDNRALQSFRDWTVVFIQVDDTYEIRPLELGRSDGNLTEVLGGLQAGDRYVVENSYLIKADIEKSGASHDH